MDPTTFEVLERIATALEKSAAIAEKDFNFRKQAAEEQAVLVQRLTQVGGSLLPTPAPQLEHNGRRARRGR